MQRTRPQLIEDKSRNLKIYPSSHFELEYELGQYRLTLDVEPLKGQEDKQYGLGVYLSNVTKWNNPPDTKITDDQKHLIKKDLEEALVILTGNYEFY